MNKEDCNKLIAEFMEIPKCSRCADCGAYQFGPAVIFFPRNMDYHKSWDWLMPVAKKCIESYGDQRQDIYHALDKVGFTELYVAVVRFIKWANMNEEKVKRYRSTGKM